MAMQAASPAAALPSAHVVGDAFVEQYYHILHESPELVYKFYQDSSVLSRPDSNGVMTSVTTMQVMVKAYETRVEVTWRPQKYDDCNAFDHATISCTYKPKPLSSTSLAIQKLDIKPSEWEEVKKRKDKDAVQYLLEKIVSTLSFSSPSDIFDVLSSCDLEEEMLRNRKGELVSPWVANTNKGNQQKEGVRDEINTPIEKEDKFGTKRNIFTTPRDEIIIIIKP